MQNQALLSHVRKLMVDLQELQAVQAGITFPAEMAPNSNGMMMTTPKNQDDEDVTEETPLVDRSHTDNGMGRQQVALVEINTEQDTPRSMTPDGNDIGVLSTETEKGTMNAPFPDVTEFDQQATWLGFDNN